MEVFDFDYNLPRKLIAKEPLIPRDSSRLMVIERKTGNISHEKFTDLPNLLPKNAVLVFNNSKVLKARLYGKIESGKIEILLTREFGKNTWECMGKPGKKLKENTEIEFENNLKGLVLKENPDGSKIIKFSNTKDLHKTIDEIGKTPLPPYLKGSKAKPEQYQTIYANPKGSVAAPTAGLHFTPNIFAELKKHGIETHFVTLHVGRGTFEPVKVKNIKDHKMHSEWFTLDCKTAEALNKAKKEGKKIIAVGTTSVRVLESCIGENNQLKPKSGETDIFIYPGYHWKFVNHMITNFHLPKSTLLMLISSFAGKELIEHAYKKAIREKYRFFSFGDAMLII